MSHDERRSVSLVREAFPEPPGLDTAVSWALLERVAAGEEPETVRLYRPGAVVAFGPADRLRPGYEEARGAARVAGFAPIERMAGGHAAVFHGETIAVAWTVPDPHPRLTIRRRFEALAEITREALLRLGVDARIGCVPGEYCPGDYSVNAEGRRKLMGAGQRLFPRAAHVGGVIVVDGAECVRSVLLPVNQALGIHWDPATVGAVCDEVGGVGWEDTTDTIIEVLAEQLTVREGTISSAVLERAHALAPRFADDPVGPS